MLSLQPYWNYLIVYLAHSFFKEYSSFQNNGISNLFYGTLLKKRVKGERLCFILLGKVKSALD